MVGAGDLSFLRPHPCYPTSLTKAMPDVSELNKGSFPLIHSVR